ncbi:MAG: DUF1772 domain-containing protein [Gammaproteobacteria bacterium]|nr:DUF1772 domain-containing protein [Gammaproteobacteria bacterium]
MTLLLHVAQVITGLMAGLYIGWAISVLPGLWLLQDRPLLSAFQLLNRAILNLPFKLLFVAAALLPPVVFIMQWIDSGALPNVSFLLAAILAVFGHALTTVAGNIPINQKLDKLDITQADSATITAMRQLLQYRWRYLHWIRTAATTLAFVLLLTGQRT